MSKEKHFSYEAEQPVVVTQEPVVTDSLENPSDVEITDVSFLTPARITFETNEGEESVMVGVDLITRKAYVGEGAWKHSDAIFEYLDRVNTLPEDFFEASEDIYDKANKATEELEDIRQQVTDLQGEA